MPGKTRLTPILALAMGLSWVLKWLTLQCYLGFLFHDLRDRADISQAEVVDVSATHRRAIAIDCYIIAWVVAEAAALLALRQSPSHALLIVAQLLAGSRIIDVLRADFNTSLFDQVRGREDNRVASTPRLVVIAMVNYVEIMACFAIVYSSHLSLLLDGLKPADVSGAVYFSVLTQLTISFGSPLPSEWLKYVAACQGLIGLSLIAVIVARMMSSLQPLKAVESEPLPPTPSAPAA